ncbi:hypothetical protein HYU15_00590 [Candidatus Woesearchaeota archaeon]|nr:hypothetical protein [Candidatus Woesearchaeota archaeon]
MKGYFVAVAVLLFLLALVSGCEGRGDKQLVKPAASRGENTPVGGGFSAIASGSTGDGDVLIEISPGEIRNGVLAADVLVNTHSVDLSQFDLADLSTLRYKGKSLKPVSAPVLSGHHSSGEMVFDLGGDADSVNAGGFAITIKGIPAVDERVFEWK